MRSVRWMFVMALLLSVGLFLNPAKAEDEEETGEANKETEDGNVAAPADTYKAAVVEFRNTVDGASAAERIANRLQRIRTHIDALPDDVDIVVFPEGAFVESPAEALTDVPLPADRITPCDNVSFDELSAMRLLSASAREKSTYVVVNAFVRQPCDGPEPTVGQQQQECVYNTNIVFDRTGTVISTYRKYNVYVEPGVNRTLQPDISSFSTDFGVVFGHTICFDIMYDTPALRLVRDGVRHVLHPTWWYSELPSLTAVQTHQGWAQANGVNLLAAGISSVSRGSTGTGLYSGAVGALRATIANGTDVVLIGDMPKEPAAEPTPLADATATVASLNRPVAERMSMIRAPLASYVLRVVNVSAEPVEYEQCLGAFCCTFRHRLVEVEQAAASDADAGDEPVPVPVAYEYVAAVFNGTRTFGGGAFSESVVNCEIIACRNASDVNTCATLYEPGETLAARYRFEELSVRGVFRRNETMVMPSTLTPSLLPLATSMYEWRTEEEEQNAGNGMRYHNVSMELKSSDPILLSFGIFGRDFRSAATSALTSYSTELGALVVASLIVSRYGDYL